MRAAVPFALLVSVALLAGCSLPNGGSAVFITRSVLFTGELFSNDNRSVDVVLDFQRDGTALDEQLFHVAPHATVLVNKTIENNCLPGVYSLNLTSMVPRGAKVVLRGAQAVRQGCGDY